ncbi:MAG: acyl-CoA dehydrogenase family protein [Acidimicrobiales bacterium]
MDFNFSEEQRAVADLAAAIFEGHATVERVKEVEASADRFDERLWAELAKANLLGIALPTRVGGSGLGMIELCLLLAAQGRAVAPVPLLATLVLGALPIAAFGTADQQDRWLPGVVSGQIVLSAGLEEPDGGAGPPEPPSVVAEPGSAGRGRGDPPGPGGGGWRLSGLRPCVPAAHLAARVVVPARTADGEVLLALVDPGGPGVERQRLETTSRDVACHLVMREAPVEEEDVLVAPGRGETGAGERAWSWLHQRAVTGVCALQLGVAEAALRMTADYTSGRHQFGRPLSTFQGVALRAADAYIDTEAMRSTLWQAAWRLDQTPLTGTSDDTDGAVAREVAVAKWWAAEGGQRVVHATQHLHGGMGADVEYPVHRYFLWGKQLELNLGGAGAQLDRIGRLLAEAAKAKAGAR